MSDSPKSLEIPSSMAVSGRVSVGEIKGDCIFY